MAPSGEETDNLPQIDETDTFDAPPLEEVSKVDFVDERLPPYQPKVIVIEDKKGEMMTAISMTCLCFFDTSNIFW